MQYPAALPTFHEGEVTLSPLTTQDTEPVFKLVMKNRMYLRNWLNWVDQNNAIDQTEKFVRKSLQQHTDHTGMTYTIWTNNIMIGVISFNWIDGLNKKAQIGYWIDEEFQGKGFTTTACRVLVRFGFETLQLHRMELIIASGNDKSSAVAKRIGFQKEATLTQAEWLNDHFTDQEIYRLLADEWHG
ncbi:MAG: GNAT family N-acetyltransferase [bacterium]|nr:GNAT family N-acetyltransferase [bacterium]